MFLIFYQIKTQAAFPAASVAYRCPGSGLELFIAAGFPGLQHFNERLGKYCAARKDSQIPETCSLEEPVSVIRPYSPFADYRVFSVFIKLSQPVGKVCVFDMKRPFDAPFFDLFVSPYIKHCQFIFFPPAVKLKRMNGFYPLRHSVLGCV